MNELGDLLAASGGQTGMAPYGGFVQGTVTENGDKKFPGMVKVEFTAWEQGMNISEWLPVLGRYAGKDHGHYWVPEVGDIVLVGFSGPMMERPFVLGSLYPAGARLPGEQFTDKNLRRCLRTKGGIEVNLLDEEGKQSLHARTPKGLRLTVSDEDEALTLTDQDGKNALTIDARGGKLHLTAEKGIALKAGGCELTLDANSGTVTLKCDRLQLEAKQTAEIKSSNLMKVEAGMLTAEGKQQLALKAAGVCEISGGMVKIN